MALVCFSERPKRSVRRGGFLVRLGGADDVDDLVDVIERNDIAFEDVLALLGLG